LPRLACNARLRRTQLLDRHGIVKSENRGVYTPLSNCVIHLRASVVDPGLFAVAEPNRAPRLVTQVEVIKASDGFYVRRPLQAPEPEQHSRLCDEPIPLPFFSHHHTSIFLLPNVPLRTAPTYTYTKRVPPCILTLRL